MKKNIVIQSVILVIIIAASFIMRLVPHPVNFIPIGALALFSGSYIKSKWGVILPVAVMVASDLIIGVHSLVLFTWGSFLLIGMIGWWIRKNRNIWRVAGGTLAGSVLFFLVTNFAVWGFTPLYQKSVAGLVNCFYMALPFFRNTALGDLFYVGVFFGLYEAVMHFAVKRQPDRQKAFSKEI
ncbi:MAG: DUF6580 family putative transport protein [Patescibacteria group bacterium]|jgi:hypothetical protein